MASSKNKNKDTYTVLVTRLANSGPVNVAVDLAKLAVTHGYRTRILYLSGNNYQFDKSSFAEVRKFQISDIITMDGVLHTHGLRPDLIGGIIAIMGKSRVLTTIQNLFVQDLSFTYPKAIVILAYRLWVLAICRMDARVCVSKTLVRYYKRENQNVEFECIYNFRQLKVVSLYSDVLPKGLVLFVDRNRAENRKILCFIGYLIPRKNLISLIKSLLEMPECALVVVGDGPEMEKAKVLVENYKISSRILFLGYHTQPVAVLDYTDALVLPSLAEGLPLVVVEALGRTKPVILSNISVHREIVRLGCGGLVSKKNLNGLKREVQRIGSDDPVFSKENTRRVFENNFSAEACFPRYEKIFKELFKKCDI